MHKENNSWSMICSLMIKQTECHLQRVQADQGILSHHAVQVDRRYRADQPNPEDLKDLEDPEGGNRTENTVIVKETSDCLNPLVLFNCH